MKIRNCGDVIACRNITFEDNKYDMEDCHPGIVLLPSTEFDESVVCLYMTSDRKRAEREQDKYIRYPGKSVKDSYVNLQHVIKNINNKESEITRLEGQNLIELLERFYNYQISLESSKEEFVEIKDKIEVLLKLLRINLQADIDTNIITDERLERFKGILDVSKLKRVYGTELLLSRSVDEEKVKWDLFSSEKERIYSDKMIELYDKLKGVNLTKLNLNDLNNPLRNIYMDFRSKNYLVNADIIFADVAILLDDDVKDTIYKFMGLEQERALKKEQGRELRSQGKKEAAKEGRAKAHRKKEVARRIKDEKKYGRFDF